MYLQKCACVCACVCMCVCVWYHTSHDALWRVRYVVEGHVCLRVPPHLGLEGHPEGRGVGQHRAGVGPLVAVVTAGRPHQEADPAGPHRVHLGDRKWCHGLDKVEYRVYDMTFNETRLDLIR